MTEFTCNDCNTKKTAKSLLEGWAQIKRIQLRENLFKRDVVKEETIYICPNCLLEDND